MKYVRAIENAVRKHDPKALERLYNKISNDETLPLDITQAHLGFIEDMLKTWEQREKERKEQAEREQAERIQILKEMHHIMINMSNEDAYMDWIAYGIPDEPTDDDFDFIAEDPESFADCVKWFFDVGHEYRKSGLCL